MSLKQIIFEGPEGGGKSTQINLLSEEFEKQNIDYVRSFEPGGLSKLSANIRGLLLDKNEEVFDVNCEFLLVSASRAQHYSILRSDKYKHLLQLIDRSFFSSLTYQGYGRGLPLDYLKQVINYTVGMDMPRVVFLMDIDPKKGIERANGEKGLDRFESAGFIFHQKVREGYLDLAKNSEYKHLFHIIDSTREIEDIHDEIKFVFYKKFPEYKK